MTKILFSNFTILIKLIILFVPCCLLCTTQSFAEEQTVITSEALEYSKDTSIYIAKGNVKIQKADAIIEADEVRYNEQTSDVTALGHVRYNDPLTSITASKAELNLETKTGKLYNTEILYRRDNYHVSGDEIEKKGDKYYFSPKAKFTTCDAPVPAWCFSGKNVDILVGDRIEARDVSFYIKKAPVLYTPYLRASIETEKHTGFLIPDVGYSKTRGWQLGLPFYWVISENRDATFIIDMYTERGIGEGLEYRYIYPRNVNGKWWIYHIKDTSLEKDFFELIANHEQRSADGVGGFLNLNIVNKKDFYREFSNNLEARTDRFLESTGEITFPFKNSRGYLLSQYWIDLKENSRPAPNRLPELGFVLHPTKVGSFWLTAETTFSNFWRDEGEYGQRLDIYPRIVHKLGSDITVLQTLGLRETAYLLNESEDNSFHREAIEYNILAHTRFLKRYGSFSHIFEPSIGYTFITDSGSPAVFDSTELFRKTSKIELSLLNRFINRGGEFMVIRASQAFDSYLGDRPFLPLMLEVGIKRPILMRLDAGYDVNTGKFENINSELYMQISGATISAGQRYNRKDNILTYVTGIGLQPYKSLYMGGRLWYDAREKVVNEISLNIKYTKQCWGVNMDFYKRPGDFTAMIMFELKGISKGLKI